jgi:hypothetical protein
MEHRGICYLCFLALILTIASELGGAMAWPVIFTFCLQLLVLLYLLPQGEPQSASSRKESPNDVAV